MRDLANGHELQGAIELMAALLHEADGQNDDDAAKKIVEDFVKGYRQILIGVEGNDKMRPNFTTLLRGLTVKKRIGVILVMRDGAGNVYAARFVRTDTNTPEKFWFANTDEYVTENKGGVEANNAVAYKLGARFVDIWERNAQGKWPQAAVSVGNLDAAGHIELV